MPLLDVVLVHRPAAAFRYFPAEVQQVRFRRVELVVFKHDELIVGFRHDNLARKFHEAERLDQPALLLVRVRPAERVKLEAEGGSLVGWPDVFGAGSDVRVQRLVIHACSP